MSFQPGTSNRTAVRFVAETGLQVTPANPVFQALRYTGESLKYSRSTATSNEIRSDRMTSDLLTVGATVEGDLNIELSYASFDELIEAALCGTWTADVLKNEVQLRSFTVQKHFQDLAVPIFQNFTGVRIGGLNLDFQTGQILTGSISTMGCNATSSTTQIAGATIQVPGDGNSPMNSVNDLTGISKNVGKVEKITVTAGGADYAAATTTVTVAAPTSGVTATAVAVIVGGVITAINVTEPGSGYTAAPVVTIVDSATGAGATATATLGGEMAAKIKSMSMELTNNLRGQEAIGTLGYIGIALGRLEITGKIELYFENGNEYQTFLDNDDFSFQFQVKDADGNSYLLQFPRVKYESGEINAGGMDEDLMVSGSWRALYDSTEACMIKITRNGA